MADDDSFVAEIFDQRIEEAVAFLSSIQPTGQYRARLKTWHTFEAHRMKTGGPPEPDFWEST